MKRHKVLLADDHAIVREGLCMMLSKEFDVVGSVEDGRSLVRAAEELEPDVALVDITMPVLNGIEAIRQLKRTSPRVKVVVFTMHADVTFATEAFAAGASGYVLKSGPSNEISTAIRDALCGKVYVAPRIASEVVGFLSRGRQQIRKPVSELTARQREVLQLLAEGKTGKEMAAELCVSRRTVEFHKYKMMQQLGLHSTAELTRYAMKHGVITA